MHAEARGRAAPALAAAFDGVRLGWIALAGLALLVVALAVARSRRGSWSGVASALAATCAALRQRGFASFSKLPEPALRLERAPDFELAASDGARVRLSDELGRGPALLVFFRGSW